MKILLIAFFTLSLFSHCNKNDVPSSPVYLDEYLLAPNICEFAVNGERKALIKTIEKYITNGRIYFFCFAFPLRKENLRPGSRFILDLEEEFLKEPRIFAVYRGAPGEALTKTAYPVAGYAERGAITITHVFYEWEEARKWYETVQVTSRK